MKFLLYFIVWHDAENHHGNIVIDTPPSRENIQSLREAIAKLALIDFGAEIADPNKQVTICNVIPLPDRIVKRSEAGLAVQAPHILSPHANGN
jgi:hypothetical protein